MFQVSDQSHDHVLSELRQALRWIEGLGIDRKHDRFAEYERIIRRYDADWKKGATRFSELTSVHRHEVIAAFVECSQIVRIWKGLRGLNPPVERVRRCLGGPVLVASENLGSASNRSRNTAFELEVLSYVKSGEVEIEDIDQVDVVCRTGGVSFFIECKRPARRKGIRKALRDGAQKAQQRLGPLVGYGVIALSLGALEPPNRILGVANFDVLRGLVQGELDAFERMHLTNWLREASSEGIGGVILHRPYAACVDDGPLMNGVELLFVTGYREGSREYADVHCLSKIVRDP